METIMSWLNYTTYTTYTYMSDSQERELIREAIERRQAEALHASMHRLVSGLKHAVTKLTGHLIRTSKPAHKALADATHA
jgi:hypothetical protein